MYLFIYSFTCLFIYLFILSFIHSLIYLLLTELFSTALIIQCSITGLYGIMSQSQWPPGQYRPPMLNTQHTICVSAVLCVFLFPSAGTGIARSATKFQKEIQKCQKHQLLSYTDLLCHKDRLQKTK